MNSRKWVLSLSLSSKLSFTGNLRLPPFTDDDFLPEHDSGLSRQWCRRAGRAYGVIHMVQDFQCEACIYVGHCGTWRDTVLWFILLLIFYFISTFCTLHVVENELNMLIRDYNNTQQLLFQTNLIKSVKLGAAFKEHTTLTTCCVACVMCVARFSCFLSPVFFLSILASPFSLCCSITPITVPVNLRSQVSKYCAYLLLSNVRETALSLSYKPTQGNWLIHHCELFLITVSNDLLMDKVKSITSFYI